MDVETATLLIYPVRVRFPIIFVSQDAYEE